VHFGHPACKGAYCIDVYVANGQVTCTPQANIVSTTCDIHAPQQTSVDIEWTIKTAGWTFDKNKDGVALKSVDNDEVCQNKSRDDDSNFYCHDSNKKTGLWLYSYGFNLVDRSGKSNYFDPVIINQG
jgi:hypothetical protein